MAVPWILISVLIVLAVFIALIVMLKNKEKRPVDYYTLFIIGIIWMGLGIPIGNYAFSAIGLVLMIVGLVHKKEWKKNQMRWEKLSRKQKRMSLILLGILLLLVILTLVIFFLAI